MGSSLSCLCTVTGLWTWSSLTWKAEMRRAGCLSCEAACHAETLFPGEHHVHRQPERHHQRRSDHSWAGRRRSLIEECPKHRLLKNSLQTGKNVSHVKGIEDLGFLTYLEMIFFRACPSIFQGKTLTSFSIFRGLGLGKPMMILKNSSLSALPFETVSGWKPSRLRRIRFFSSTVNRKATSCSSREMVSTLVAKHSCRSSHQIQLTVMLFGGRSSGAIGAKVALMVVFCCDRVNCTSRRLARTSSPVHPSAMLFRSPWILSTAFCGYM